MALTITPRAVDQSNNFKVDTAALFMTLTSVTVGVAGDYSAGGIVLTPAQLGFTSSVFFGNVNVRTPGGAGTISGATLDCTTPGAPKAKCNALTAECAGAGVAGAVLDIQAFGF